MPDEYGSPEYWLKRLSKELNDRRRAFQKRDDYYTGKHPLLFSTQRFSDVFHQVFAGWADNWCGLVVDAVEERLTIEGFRVGGEQRADDEAWRIWQENGLDADSKLNHIETLVTGFGYVIVWAGDDERTPEITVEDPQQVIVGYAAGSRRRRAAALKKWLDDSGYEFATLYLPNEIMKFQSSSKRPTSGDVMTTKWVQREVKGENWPLENPLGVVTVVEFQNNPRARCTGDIGRHSEIHKVIPIQDGINKLTVDLFVASEYSGFRQRWATGLDIPRDPETGEPIEKFKAAIDRLWVNPSDDPGAKFGEFEETNLGNFVKAIEMLIQHVAAQTRTPPHYLLGQSGAFPSGESLKSTESGLVAKVGGKFVHLGEQWEEVFRLGFKVIGDARGDRPDSEIRWRNPEFRTEGELVDALTKMDALGVPREVLWEKWGGSPQEIARWKAIARQEAIEASLAEFGTGRPGDQGLPPEPEPVPVGDDAGEG